MNDDFAHHAASAYHYPLLIKNLLFAPVARNPEQEIVYRGRLRFTYRQFQERVCRLASALVGMGVRPGDTVAVMDYDSHRYLECFFAVPMIGAVLHTINVRLTPEQILYTIDHAEDDLLLVHADFLPILEQIKGRMESVRALVLIADDRPRPESHLEFATEYEQLLAESSPAFDFPDFDENSRATTFYTTGTTGLPKGVYFSHRQLVLHTFAGLAALATPNRQGRFHREDVYMPLTPMFHVHAWGIPYMATTLGVKQVYPGRYVPEHLLALIGDERVTFSHCVPTILHLLLKHPSSTGVDLSGLKMIIGGATLPKALCLEAVRRGIDIYSGYGMSETCPILTLANLDASDLLLEPEAQVEMRCKTGRPLPLVHLELVDEEMVRGPADGTSPGEIVVRSPWLTQGYLKDAKNSEKLWHGGWLHTSDMAVQDARGFVKITDRLKDVIKIAGEWLSSLELEDILAHHPGVAEVAVIGQADEKWGERPLALVVRKPEHDDLTEKILVNYMRGYASKGIISKQALLLKVRFVEAIEKTSVGKVNKVALRKKHL